MKKTDRNHEILKTQPLLNKKGRITECGWSRSQLQVYDRREIHTNRLRIKEWDYYLILHKDYGVAFTLSDDGYIGLQSVSLLNFAQNREHTETILNMMPMGRFNLPSSSVSGNLQYEDKRLKMSFTKTKDKRVIRCHFERFCDGRPLDCHIELLEPAMDSIVVATPWKESKSAFYYNQKINCMRAKGYVQFDGTLFEFDPLTDFGTLDWGRGVWTYDNVWYWGNGNCDIDGHSFGFNIGYGFGDTTAATENALFYDGVLHKLDDVKFHIPKDDYLKPWQFTSSDGRFEMNFKPVLDRAAKISALVIETDQHQVFGKLNGKAVLDDGTVINVKDMLCFAEKVHNRY